MLVVGARRAGKTTLVRCLTGENTAVEYRTTDDLTISRWPLDTSEGTVRVDVWDFGGSDIYSGAQRIVLGPNSLYLVVTDRAAWSEGGADLWLRDAATAAGGSPLLLVFMKYDSAYGNVDEDRLAREYGPALRGIHHVSVRARGIHDVSAHTVDGLSGLIDAIRREVRTIPTVTALWPARWFDVRDRLAAEALRKRSLPMEEVDVICRDCGVKDPREQGDLLRALHALGAVLIPGPLSSLALPNAVILNPGWALLSVSRILAKRPKQERNGRLRAEDLAKSDSPDLSPADVSLLLDLMCECELCFDVRGASTRTVLIPQWVEPDEPPLPAGSDAGLHFRITYDRLSPTELIRFVARVESPRATPTLYWRNGVLLETGDNLVVVRQDAPTRRISLVVSGPVPGRRTALAVVRDHLLTVHQQEQSGPAEEDILPSDNQTVAVRYEELLRLETEGVSEIRPEGADRAYSVRGLLDGTEEPPRAPPETPDVGLEELRNALLSAFDQPSLERLLRFRLNVVLSHVVRPGPLTEIVTELLSLAQREGWLTQLIDAAYQQNPRNAELRAVYEQRQMTGRPDAPSGAVPPHPKRGDEMMEEMYDALLSAFDRNSFERMLRIRLDVKLSAKVADGPMNYVVFQLLDVAAREGWQDRLIESAYRDRPRNAELRAVYEKYGLAPRASVNGQAVAFGDIEGVVAPLLSSIDITAWLERATRIEAQVCCIEIDGAPRATGFLVGPDALLTTYHALGEVIDGKVTPNGVLFRFGLKRLRSGETVGGTPFKLAADWLIDASPYTASEKSYEPDAVLPTTEELDYVLVRLEGRPGERPLYPQTEGVLRNWIVVPRTPVPLTEGRPLMIAQCPAGEPVQLALDTEAILGVNSNHTRVRYRTNTAPGSSGAPCLDFDWRLVAMHHYGDPVQDQAKRYNQGIPIDAIYQRLTRLGKQAALGDEFA